MSSRSERKRARIRQAAYRSFRDFGYHDTSVDSICRAAGISKGSFYWHYDSKQEVFVDILETWTREVMDEVIEQFEAALERHDAVKALALAFAREIHRGRAIVPLWLEFTVLARREPEIQRALSRFYRRARAAISEMLRPLVRGQLGEDQIRAMAAVILGAYAGIVMQDLADPTWVDAAQVADHFMSVLGGTGLGRDTIAAVSAMGRADSRDSDLDAEPSSPTPLDRPRRLTATSASHSFVSAAARKATDGSRVEPRELDGLVNSVAPDSARLVAELRELVLDIAPGADERVISGWRVIAYDLGGLFAYIKPTRDDELHLGFYHGASLADPDGLLSGGGKRQRHVRLPLDAPVDMAALARLVEQAVAARLALAGEARDEDR